MVEGKGSWSPDEILTPKTLDMKSKDTPIREGRFYSYYDQEFDVFRFQTPEGQVNIWMKNDKINQVQVIPASQNMLKNYIDEKTLFNRTLRNLVQNGLIKDGALALLGFDLNDSLPLVPEHVPLFSILPSKIQPTLTFAPKNDAEKTQLIFLYSKQFTIFLKSFFNFHITCANYFIH